LSGPLDIPSIGIAAIAYALPEETIGLRTLEERGLLESPADALAQFGFRCIHVSDRPADDLALIALRRLIDEQQIDPESVDALFYAGAIPESQRVADGGTALEGFNYPAARLQYECGLVNAGTIGIAQAGCTGLLCAVALAADHLRANNGARRAICVSADVLPAGCPREIIFNVVSDGGCAVLVERGGLRNRILAYRRVAKGYYWQAAARRNEIVAAYFPTARTVVRDTLASCGLSASDIALILPHNVSLRSWQILLPLLGMSSDRLFSENIAAKGHVISADNFINLKDAGDRGRIAAGDRLMLFSFGFGANWACMVLEA
jgi:3-oxoacyl-[acyl-carrier-protein] synthase III